MIDGLLKQIDNEHNKEDFLVPRLVMMQRSDTLVGLIDMTSSA
jgi:hypothetical protein